MTAPTSSIESKSKSRRALLAGALGGLGAWAASAVGRASPVRAENEYIQVGGEYTTATSQTRIRNETNTEDVFRAESSTSGTALGGTSNSGIAVFGWSTSYYGVFGHSASHVAVHGQTNTGVGVNGFSGYGKGVYGSSSAGLGVGGFTTATNQPAVMAEAHGNSTGVLGYSGTKPTPAAKAKTGVYGHATQDIGSRGVWGRSNAGQGVRGQATSGVGLFGTATNGFALRTAGRTKLSTSGVATIAAGSTSKTVTPGVDVTSGSFVLLTPKANIGSRALWFTTNASANTFTIRLSSSRSSGTKVAWLLLG
ncbi:MAG TPA: hypothetical protein VF071_07350 [Candidatus Limnocylindria bacterium]